MANKSAIEEQLERAVKKHRKDEAAHKRALTDMENQQRDNAYFQGAINKLAVMTHKDIGQVSIFELPSRLGDKLSDASLATYNNWSSAIMELAQALAASSEVGTRITSIAILMAVDTAVNFADDKVKPLIKNTVAGAYEALRPRQVELPKLVYDVHLDKKGALEIKLKDAFNISARDPNRKAVDGIFNGIVEKWLVQQQCTPVPGSPGKYLDDTKQPLAAAKLKSMLEDPVNGLDAFLAPYYDRLKIESIDENPCYSPPGP